MEPGDIAKQKTVDSNVGGASVLIGNWRDPLHFTLNVSTRKKLDFLAFPYLNAQTMV